MRCGEGAADGYNYLYVNEPDSSSYNQNTVCVKKCPDSESDNIECVPNTDIISCSFLNVYSSYGFFNRICIPSSSDKGKEVKSNINLSFS